MLCALLQASSIACSKCTISAILLRRLSTISSKNWCLLMMVHRVFLHLGVARMWMILVTVGGDGAFSGRTGMASKGCLVRKVWW